MPDPLYGLTADDVATLREMARSWRGGEDVPRPRHQRKRLPFRYSGGGTAYFEKLGATVAGRSSGTAPYTISQNTTASNWGKDDSGTLSQISGSNDPYNYSKLPVPLNRLHPVMVDSGGTPFMLPMWSCFGIQCVGSLAYSATGISLSGAGRPTFTTWLGPNGASSLNNTLWYNRNTDEFELLTLGDYIVHAGAQFQCAATTAAHQAGYLILSDNNNAPLNDSSSATASWRSDASNITYANVSCMTLHERSSSSSTQAVTPIISLSGSAICTHVWMIIMPCGFGESG